MHGRHRTATSHGAPRRTRWSLLLLLSVAQLMVILDISAVNVALPDLAADLSIGQADIGWTITSYSLIFGSLLLFGGRAADLLGRRRVFLAGLAVFTASSLVTALAADATMLFAARAGQGLGAALLSPAALSIITTAFQGPERAKALGVWGAVGGAGAAIGVLLGGVLTGLLGGRVYAISQAQTSGWSSTQTLGIGAAAIAGLAAFAALELRTRRPLLRIQRLTDRAIGGGFLMMLTGSAVLFGSFLLSSLYLQNVLGAGPLESGLAFLPFAAAIAVGVHAATHVITHAGIRIPLAAGFAISGAGMLLLSGVSPEGSYVADALPGMLV